MLFILTVYQNFLTHEHFIFTEYKFILFLIGVMEKACILQPKLLTLSHSQSRRTLKVNAACFSQRYYLASMQLEKNV